MTVATQDDQVTDLQLANYAKLIYKVTGICVSPKKKALLSNRIRRRLRATGIASFEIYYKKLKKAPIDDPEWDALVGTLGAFWFIQRTVILLGWM